MKTSILKFLKYTPAKNVVAKYYNDLFWESKDGTKVLVSEMTDERLKNTLAFVYRHKASIINGYDRNLALSCLEKHAQERNISLDEVKELSKIRFLEKISSILNGLTGVNSFTDGLVYGDEEL